MGCTHSAHRQEKAFKWALVIAVIFMVIELIGGLVASSLALISDALHMFTDVGSLLLGLIVVRIANLPKTPRMSFGYHRSEVLGGLASALFLWILSFFLIYEAIHRLKDPQEVNGPLVFIIATVGLLANLAMMKLLHPVHKESLNTRAAYLHIISDLIGSVGVILSGLLIWIFHWYPLDAIITIVFTCSILYHAGKVVKESVSILMQSTPPGIHPDEIQKDLKELPSVQNIHDLHVWAVTQERVALSVHILSTDPQKTLQEAHDLLAKKYRILHTTIQVEDPDHVDPKSEESLF